jgi:hypothetical protein
LCCVSPDCQEGIDIRKAVVDVDAEVLLAWGETCGGPIALAAVGIGHCVFSKTDNALSPHAHFFASGSFEDVQQVESVLAFPFMFYLREKGFCVGFIFFFI